MAEQAGRVAADGTPGAAPDHGRLRASRADREQAVDTLQTAFAQGHLDRGEFGARVSQALAARTYTDLAAVRGGLPAEPAAAQPLGQPPRAPLSNGARWAVAGLITPAVVAAAFVADSLPGDRGYAIVALIAALGYFIYWLSTGADMLWEWHSTASPKALPCVRCAHTAAAHHAATHCQIRAGSVDVRQRCQCAGYLPPGLSPKSINLTA